MEVDSDSEAHNDERREHLTRGPEAKAREMEQYHKEQAALARQKQQKLAFENQQLSAQLQHAQRSQAEQNNRLKSLHEELLKIQQHEGEMESQFFGDQASIKALWGQCNTLTPQLLEAQRLLMLRNEEVERLSRLVVEKDNQAIQLHAAALLGGKKNNNKPPPRRGTRASLAPVQNTGARTIQIPLDPVPIPAALGDKPNPTQRKGKLPANPVFADMLGIDVDTLTDMMGKLDRLLGSDTVTVNLEETTSKKKKKMAAPKKILRDTTYTKFNVMQASDFSVYNPAEDAKVAACDAGQSDPAEDLFQWDFTPGYAGSRWNELMITKVVDAALEDDGRDGVIAESGVDRDFLEVLMSEKLARYRGAWRSFQPRFNEDLGRMETKNEASHRGAQAYEQHQLNCLSTTTKTRKFDDRVETVTMAIDIKEVEGAADLGTWLRFLDMLKLLGPHGMSSEEDDSLEAEDEAYIIYRVKLCVWREPRVIEYLRFIDAQTILFKKGKRGPKAAKRIRDRIMGSSKAPIGLPKALYNSDWLRKQTPAYIKQLKVSKKAFALFVAATERMAV